MTDKETLTVEEINDTWRGAVESIDRTIDGERFENMKTIIDMARRYATEMTGIKDDLADAKIQLKVYNRDIDYISKRFSNVRLEKEKAELEAQVERVQEETEQHLEAREQLNLQKLQLEETIDKLRIPMENFIRKVDEGKARSTESYREMKEALDNA